MPEQLGDGNYGTRWPWTGWWPPSAHADILIHTNLQEVYTDVVGAHLEVEAWLRQMMARVKERSDMLTEPLSSDR